MPKTDWRAADVEIVDGRYVRNQSEARAEETIEKIAWLMDKSIPIGGIRIGLDPLVGLASWSRRHLRRSRIDSADCPCPSRGSS